MKNKQETNLPTGQSCPTGTSLGKLPNDRSRAKSKRAATGGKATIIPAKKGNIRKYLPKVFGTATLKNGKENQK